MISCTNQTLSNFHAREGLFTALPEDPITCISACFIPSGEDNKQHPPVAPVIRNLSLQTSGRNFTRGMSIPKQSFFVTEKASYLKQNFAEKFSVWRDLTSFAGTCKHIYKSVVSNAFLKDKLERAKRELVSLRSGINVLKKDSISSSI